MSATAFTVTELGMILLSDGIATSLDDKSVISKDSRKVWKLSNSVSLIWMGATIRPISHVIDPVMGMSANEAIHHIANTLEGVIAGNAKYEEHLEEVPFNIFTFECHSSGVEYYQLFYKEHRFTPIHKGVLRPLQNGALIYDGRSAPWSKLMKKHWAKMRISNRTPEVLMRAAEKATSAAFKEMIELLRSEDPNIPVGGRIYQETLTP